MPALSIITANLNNKSGLENTIKSVIGQTFRNFEYIIIDGGSTDSSTSVIAKYSKNLSKSISEPDKGIYNAMNKALHIAKGKYCLFLNSGDYLYSENTLAKVFKKELAEDIVYGDMIIENISGKKVMGQMPEQITLEHMIKDTLWHPVSFIKRELFNKFGYYREDLKIAGDYDFFFRTLIVNKVSTLHISMPVAVFVLDGISSQKENIGVIQNEREKVQLEFMDKKTIESIKQKINNEQKNKVVRNNSLTGRIWQWFH